MSIINSWNEKDDVQSVNRALLYVWVQMIIFTNRFKAFIML